jgi:hypothetical protein
MQKGGMFKIIALHLNAIADAELESFVNRLPDDLKSREPFPCNQIHCIADSRGLKSDSNGVQSAALLS